MRLVFVIGLPGSGKTTVGRQLAKQYKLPFVSAGDWIRREISSHTPLGRRLKKDHDAGRLNDLGDLRELFTSRFFSTFSREEKNLRSEFQNGFVLEGFPRSIEALQLLELIFGKEEIAKAEFHHLFTPVREAVRRMVVERRRADDTPEVAATKIAVFKRKTFPLIKFLRSQKRLARTHTVHSDLRMLVGKRSVKKRTSIMRTLLLARERLKKMREKQQKKLAKKLARQAKGFKPPKRRPRG